MRVYIGNLPFRMSGDELRALFETHGQVDSAMVISDRDTGRSRGFGFVEMTNEADGRKAIEALAGHEIDGRALVVNEARPREERERHGGGGGYGGGGGDRGGGGGGYGGGGGDRGGGGGYGGGGGGRGGGGGYGGGGGGRSGGPRERRGR